MKTFRNYCVPVSCFFLFYLLTACSSQSYPANTPISRSSYSAAIERAKKNKWNMVLHSGINVYAITSVQVDKAKQQATVQLDKVDSSYMAVSNPSAGAAKGKTAAMHWYTSDSTSYTLDEPHTIVLDKVVRMERVD